MNKEELKQIKSTIALLSSMIDGGETHSEVSRKAVSEAYKILNSLNTRPEITEEVKEQIDEVINILVDIPDNTPNGSIDKSLVILSQLSRIGQSQGESEKKESEKQDKSNNFNSSMVRLKVWDNHNKQWLEPMAIYFGKDNIIWKVDACKPNEEPLKDGWYDLKGDELKKIAIIGDFNYNTELLPNDG